MAIGLFARRFSVAVASMLAVCGLAVSSGGVVVAKEPTPADIARCEAETKAYNDAWARGWAATTGRPVSEAPPPPVPYKCGPVPDDPAPAPAPKPKDPPKINIPELPDNSGGDDSAPGRGKPGGGITPDGASPEGPLSNKGDNPKIRAPRTESQDATPPADGSRFTRPDGGVTGSGEPNPADPLVADKSFGYQPGQNYRAMLPSKQRDRVPVPDDYVYDPEAKYMPNRDEASNDAIELYKGRHDYCSTPYVSIQGVGNYEFIGACARYDKCYDDNPNDPWNVKSEGKKECDEQFKQDLYTICEGFGIILDPAKRFQCFKQADFFYDKVKEHGGYSGDPEPPVDGADTTRR